MSVQNKLGRVRPEIFHIKYEVDTGGAIEKRELAFVMGVLSDLSGDRVADLGDLSEEKRSFINLDRDNFSAIQEKINPHLELQVPNELLPEKDGKKQNLGLSLNFPTMDHFGPEGVIKQIEPLKELLEVRQKLASLAARIDGKQDVMSKLEELLRRSEGAVAGAASAPATEAKEEKGKDNG